MEFYHAATTLADAMIARFYDREAGAFYDTAAGVGEEKLGALTARRKPLQDSPTPAGNATAASALLRLEALSGRKEFREIAEDTLESFAGIVEHFGLYAGSYGLALERLLLDPVQVVIVGSGPEAARLEATAVARFGVQKTVMRIGPFRIVPGGVPEELEQMLVNVPAPEGASVWAIVCRGRTCLPPVTDAEALLAALEGGTRRIRSRSKVSQLWSAPNMRRKKRADAAEDVAVLLGGCGRRFCLRNLRGGLKRGRGSSLSDGLRRSGRLINQRRINCGVPGGVVRLRLRLDGRRMR